MATELSSDYLDLTDSAFATDQPLKPPTDVVCEVAVDALSLSPLRRTVARHARALGLSDGRTDDLVLAVNEVTSNTVRHAGGHGTMRIWRDDESLVCDVEDGGRITDPLVGRRPPADDSEGGRGLWIATQLCDLIEVRSFPTGSVVRLHMRFDN